MIMDRGRKRDRLWLKAAALLSATVLLFSGLWVFLCSGAAGEDRPLQSQPEGNAFSPLKTVIELQPYRETNSIEIKGAQAEDGLATLTNLNPTIGVWHLLRIKWRKDATEEVYHLENAGPRTQKLLLDQSNPHGLLIAEGEKRFRCDLWGTQPHSILKQAKSSGAAYIPLCGGRLFLRNPVKGHRTKIELVTEFLR